MSSSADEAVVALDGESDQLLGGGEAPELVEPFQEKDEGAFPWLKLLLALVVIGGPYALPVIALIVLAVLMTSPVKEQRPLTIEDLTDPLLQPNIIQPKWTSGGQFLESVNGSYYLTHARNGDRTLISNGEISLSDGVFTAETMTLSSNGRWGLAAFEVKQKFRHSFVARFAVLDVAKSVWWEVPGCVNNLPCITNVLWGNGEAKNNAMPPFENDIYVVPTQALNKNTQPQRVTITGSPTMLNGKQGWVYEEEIFASSTAMWWSDDDSYLAFLSTDESQVKVMSIPFYEDVDVSPYTTLNRIRYPKSGTANPVAKVGVYQTAKNIVDFVKIPKDVEYEYVTGVGITTDALFVRTLNRLQTVENLSTFDLPNRTIASTFVTQEVKGEGWIETYPIPTPVDVHDQRALIIIKNVTNYYHIVLIDGQDGHELARLTSGDWDVRRIAGIDHQNKLVYFESTKDSPTTQSVSVVSYDVPFNADPWNVYIVKEDAIRDLGDAENFCTLSLNKECTFGILSYLGPDLPMQVSLFLPLEGTDAKAIGFVIEDNEEVRKRLDGIKLPTVKWVKSNGVTHSLYTKLMIGEEVKGVDSSLLLAPYGGPNSRTAVKKWSLGLNEYLTTLGIHVATVDNVGTGGRGIRFMQDSTYLKLGIAEIADQAAAAASLLTRSDIHVTVSALEEPTKTFKTAVSVAPVTDWRLYDSVYTERYMQTPESNPKGYNETSTLLNIDRFDGKLLLIHGTGDDNVHFQNSAELDKVLISNDIQFETMIYPNRQHSIRSGHARRHLYQLISDYLEKNLVPKRP